MSLDQRKIQLITWIASIKDDTLIAQLELIRKELGDWHSKLPEELKDILKKSESQIQEGKTVSHEVAMKKLHGRL